MKSFFFLNKILLKKKILSLFKDVSIISKDSCDFCGSKIIPLKNPITHPQIGFLYLDEPFYYLCEQCNLLILNPTVEPSEKLYDQAYSEIQKNAYFDKRIEFVKKYLPSNNVKILDIGGSSGKFAELFKHSNYDVVTLDISKEAIQQVKEKGLQGLCGDILSIDIPPNSYDYVTMWEFIEHIDMDLFKNILKKVYSILKKGGLCIISTPNKDSFSSKNYDFYISSLPYHKFVFSAQSLKYFFKQFSFEKVEIIENNLSSDNWLLGWFYYYSSATIDSIKRQKSRIELNKYLNNEKNIITNLNSKLKNHLTCVLEK